MLHSQYADPYGGKLRSLERNLIRYRTTQIALLLYYAEELKDLIVGSVVSTDNICIKLKGNAYRIRLPQGAKKVSEKALEILVQDGVLTTIEASECRNVFDSRNNAAHEIHVLLADLSNVTFARSHAEFNVKKYDYEATHMAKKYIELIWDRLPDKGYITPLGMGRLLFSASERFYQSELKRLDKIINKQLAQRKRQNNELKRETHHLTSKLNDHQHPSDPKCKNDNGTLTKHGAQVCYCLFDLQASAHAVAHLMSISIDAARNRKKMWKAELKTKNYYNNSNGEN